MNPPSLWDRVRRARIVQVLAVYLGASWGVLQIADTLTEALSLPPWVSPVAIILLLVGAVIILATAWVQSLPTTTAAEEAGERPTDWEIAPAEAVESLKSGRLPALTWGRAILGGIVALSLLFGGTGLWVTVTGGPGLLGPTQVGATDVADAIAILPFNVNGVDDEAFWGEGMVDLLSTNLDGMGGYRTIDSRTVLARWRENAGNQAAPDLATALRAAGATGARYAVVGSAVGVGGNLRLVTEVYDLATSEEIGSGQVQGSSDDPLKLIDDLSLETMRLLLAGGGEELATTRNLADLTTASIPALRAYLEGERHYRQANFPQAVEAYQRALDADSTFALALFRISDAYGWLESVSSEIAADLGERALAYVGDLSPRNAAIVSASQGLYIGDMTQARILEQAVRRYPDDPEAWFMLAELYIHLGEGTGAGPREALDAIERAIALDPGFAPYYVHAIDQNMVLGNGEAARQLIDSYQSLSASEQFQEEYLVAFDLYFGDTPTREAARQRMAALDNGQLGVMCGTFCPWHEDLVRSLEIYLYQRDRNNAPGWMHTRWLTSAGKVARAQSMLRDSLPEPREPGAVYVHRLLTDDGAPDLLPSVRGCDPEAVGRLCEMWKGLLAAEEGDWGTHGASIRYFEQWAAELDAAGDSVQRRYPLSDVGVLRGYAALIQGDPARARQEFESIQGTTDGSADELARLWLGRANEELGRYAEAAQWYGLVRTTPYRSMGYAARARMLEQLGQVDEARALWRIILNNYREADDGFEPAITARAELARLGG